MGVGGRWEWEGDGSGREIEVGNLGNRIYISPAARSAGWGYFRDFRFEVMFGRAGLTSAKREGDGKTPLGLFALRRVMWRADRLARPPTALPIAALDPSAGWCDAPLDSAYNRFVRLPYSARAESLWRSDQLYDIIIVIGFNDDPPKPYRGSAIFIHLMGRGAGATEGCIALARQDMLTLLARIDLETKIEIRRFHARQK